MDVCLCLCFLNPFLSHSSLLLSFSSPPHPLLVRMNALFTYMYLHMCPPWFSQVEDMTAPVIALPSSLSLSLSVYIHSIFLTLSVLNLTLALAMSQVFH